MDILDIMWRYVIVTAVVYLVVVIIMAIVYSSLTLRQRVLAGLGIIETTRFHVPPQDARTRMALVAALAWPVVALPIIVWLGYVMIANHIEFDRILVRNP